ncbi:NAD(P)H-hydrate dehydratase [Neisseria musculi]|uniref:NAD(P)H-hydrate dehydratase n=1 Tax=Neisseria musculi TaxID=1815583 RepID=UPI00164BA205|nr:NAD(P)H-hydrate dehydratase [Neisseria musculi]
MMFSSPYQSKRFAAQLEAALQFPQLFTPRAADSHKGTHGTLAVVGGAAGMSGAVILAATAAIYSGCGKVWAGFNQNTLPLPVVPERPEIMLATAPVLQQRDDISAWVFGCGLGLCSEAASLLRTQLQRCGNEPLLLDADALTLLARHPEAAAQAGRRGNVILTPHPAEAARLLGISTADVQADRGQAAECISRRFNAYTVLKGRHTSICAPNGSLLHTNRSGNPGLAAAGSGDVLSGIIGSLLAQSISPEQAICGGVWLHGAAADVLKDSETGETGMLSGEIAPAARWLRNRITANLHPESQARETLLP